MRLDKLIHERGTMSSEAQKVEFEVPTDMTVHEFKRICKRMASALGYSSNSIDEAFGKTSNTNNSKTLLKG